MPTGAGSVGDFKSQFMNGGLTGLEMFNTQTEGIDARKTGSLSGGGDDDPNNPGTYLDDRITFGFSTGITIQSRYNISDLLLSPTASPILAGAPVNTDAGLGLQGTGFTGRYDTSGAPADPNTNAWFEFFHDIVIDLGAEYEAFAAFLTDYGDGGAPAGRLEVGLFKSDGTTQVGSWTKVGPQTNPSGGPVGDPSTTSADLLFYGVQSDGNPFQIVKLRFVNVAAKDANGNVVTDPRCDGNDGTTTTASANACQIDPVDVMDFVGIDDIVFGDLRNADRNPTVPEPGSLAILGLGLLAVRRFGRR